MASLDGMRQSLAPHPAAKHSLHQRRSLSQSPHRLLQRLPDFQVGIPSKGSELRLTPPVDLGITSLQLLVRGSHDFVTDTSTILVGEREHALTISTNVYHAGHGSEEIRADGNFSRSESGDLQWGECESREEEVGDGGSEGGI